MADTPPQPGTVKVTDLRDTPPIADTVYAKVCAAVKARTTK
jgi:hypothetical protein